MNSAITPLRHNKKPYFPQLLLLFLLAMPALVLAQSTPEPSAVTIAGNFQNELGCPSDWSPDCSTTYLALELPDGVWQGIFSIPAGSWEYKAALNNSWAENYGLNATAYGPNIPLTLAQETAVKFYYDHQTHWITDNQNSVIATLPGNYQTHLGAGGNWQPDFMGTWLQDPDGDGIYTFLTSALPAGSYECKVAINESWDENYGEGGVPYGPNIQFSVPEDNAEVFFSYNPQNHVLTIQDGSPKGDLSKSYGQWLTRDTLVWNLPVETGDLVKLHYSYDAELVLEPAGISGGSELTLTPDPAGLSEALRVKFPYLADFPVFKINPADIELVPAVLHGQTALSLTDSQGKLKDATSIQTPGVLDDLYAYDGELGVVYQDGTPSIKVWAPTAQMVRLHLFDDASPATPAVIYEMTADSQSGVWSIDGEAAWDRKYYLFEVTVYAPCKQQLVVNLVTDPYSLNLSLNSKRSQVINLGDADLKPRGWARYAKPDLKKPEDIVINELHIRDFSIADNTVKPQYRGTYKAFTQRGSAGMKHLATLARAGLTHIHLLPTFDIATINEDRSTHLEPDYDYLKSLPPDSAEQQAAIAVIRDKDGFNWGYDPFHYTVPEGSYATSAQGVTRILEFREMVKALNRAGLRVVMDVVYNHTNASGMAEKSVFDKIVPGYYHRRSLSGSVENSTCCSNTASEHHMMEKLMIDSLLRWAKAYKVDGFRFDLMGHHMKSNMIKIKDRLAALTIKEDGVDGSKIYLYGEGWNFGEVAGNARGVNATQLNMPGTGIGTFSDRLRDAVRGGSPVRGESIREQGFANGLYYDPNATDQGDQLTRLLLFADQIRVGLTGNLADYSFTDRNGNTATGADVDYNGSPAGYTKDPSEVVTYVESHDDRTLFDIIQLKTPVATSLAQRIRIQNLSTSMVALSQGVIFFQAGQDMLRSKSMDRDSYDSGDWFNRLDFSYHSNNWGIGLPREDVNGSYWPLMAPLLANLDLKPTREDIQGAAAYFKSMLKIRKSSSLFHLQTAQEIQAALSFHNTGPGQIPGLIVMSLTDPEGQQDRKIKKIVVLFNALPNTTQFQADPLSGWDLILHPQLLGGKDPVVRSASYDKSTGSFTIPGRTTAVFVALRPVPEQLQLLINDIQILESRGVLTKQQARFLTHPLAKAINSYEQGKVKQTRFRLWQGLLRVKLYVWRGILSRAEGEELVGHIKDILKSL